MIRFASRAFFLALPLAVAVAGCGSPSAPTVTTTTTTTTTTTSTTVTAALDTISGTLVAGGRVTLPPAPPATPTGFDAQPGVITVTLTVLDPNVVLPAIGMGLGIFDVPSGTCNLVVGTTSAQVGTVVTGTASIASSATTKFCVQLWDVNGFAAGYVQGFTLTISYQKLIVP